MKELFKKLTAAASVCVLAVCGVSVPDSSALSLLEVTITFDCESDGATLDEEYDLMPITTSYGTAITIPEGYPERDGFYCTGWTDDDIHAYTEGDTFIAKSDEDIVLKPIWCEKNQETKYTVRYVVEIDGEILDTEKRLPDREYYVGQIAEVSLESYSIYRTDSAQFGWTDGITEFEGQQKFIVHEHDVTLTPNWKKKYKLTHSVGDVDRIVGMTSTVVDQPEGTSTNTADGKTFSRKGFKFAGWLCDADNKVYAEREAYKMPGQDVTFTAVWTPKEYTVVFKQDKKSANNLKVAGVTDTIIKTPEPTITVDGSYFAGWKYEDKIYPANADFMILGAIDGMGIVLEAVWTDEMPEETTATTAPQTTTEAQTTTPTTSSPVSLYGDADDNGSVNINDTVLIMQSIANPDRYSLTETGKANADVVNVGDGVTNSDALAIQYVESRTISAEDLPITSEKLDTLAG